MPADSARSFSGLFWSGAAWLFFTSVSLGHDPGLSSSHATIERHRIEAEVTFSREEIETLVAAKGRVDLAGKLRALEDEVLVIEGKSTESLRAIADDDGNVTFRLNWSGPFSESVSIRSPLVSRLPPGHRQYLIVRDETRNLIARQFLTAKTDSMAFENPYRFSAPDSKPEKPGTSRLWIFWISVTSVTIPVFLALWRRVPTLKRRKPNAGYQSQHVIRP